MAVSVRSSVRPSRTPPFFIGESCRGIFCEFSDVSVDRIKGLERGQIGPERGKPGSLVEDQSYREDRAILGVSNDNSADRINCLQRGQMGPTRRNSESVVKDQSYNNVVQGRVTRGV